MPSTQVRETPADVDPIAALIAAFAPTGPAEILREMPVPSEAAQADRERRRQQARHNAEGLPRHLIGVDALRYGETL